MEPEDIMKTKFNNMKKLMISMLTVLLIAVEVAFFVVVFLIIRNAFLTMGAY